MVPRRPPRPAAGLTRRVEGARLTRCQIDSGGADSAGLAWSAIYCVLTYLIIIWRICWPVQRPALRLVSGYALEVLRRCDTLQRGTGGIIAACVGLLFAAVEWGKSHETPL